MLRNGARGEQKRDGWVPGNRGRGECATVAWIGAAEQVSGEEAKCDDGHRNDQRALADHRQDRLAASEKEDNSSEKKDHPTDPVGKGRKPRVLSRQLLADIIQPRAEEIFRLVDSDIKRMGYDKSLNSGIVLTGGTALLEGLAEVAEEIFDLPVRRGDPSGVGGLVDRVSTPDFATSVGLTLYGFHTWQDKGLSRDRKKGGWAKFKDWFKEG